MTYFSGLGSASTIKTQLQTTIPANAAWSLVESTTFGADSYAADVYKCDSTVSGLSADFYVMVLLNSSSLYFGIAEGYNTSTHKPQRPAVKATSSLVTLEADGGVLADDTEIDWYEGTSGGLSVAAVSLGTTTTTYYISVAKDCLMIGLGIISTTYGVAVAGAYESLVDDDDLPIMVGVASGSSSSFAYATRHPARGGLATGYACNLNGAVVGDARPTLFAPSTGADFTPLAAPGDTSANAYDAYRGTDPGAAKIAVLNSYGTSAGIGRVANGWRRGWMKHMRCTPTTNLTVGDTLLIDGVQYYYIANGVWVEMDPA